MNEITNVDTLKEIREGIKVTPLNVSPKNYQTYILPTLEVNPKFFRRINVVRSGTSSTTSTTASIYTTPTDKDFYLTSVVYFLVKDATCDNVASTFKVTPFGDSFRELVNVPSITTTALNTHIAIAYPIPMKLARGTTCVMSSTFTVGVLTRGASITGYEVEIGA